MLTQTFRWAIPGFKAVSDKSRIDPSDFPQREEEKTEIFSCLRRYRPFRYFISGLSVLIVWQWSNIYSFDFSDSQKRLYHVPLSTWVSFFQCDYVNVSMIMNFLTVGFLFSTLSFKRSRWCCLTPPPLSSFVKDPSCWWDRGLSQHHLWSGEKVDNKQYH